MADEEIEETPVAPAPHEQSPSSTGVVDGDGSEPVEAPEVEGMS
jgi:hypothetical protein